MEGKRLAALTGIRGAAAAWVVMFHAYPMLGPLFGWPERAQVPVVRDGFLAVDLFFILSGFVLSHAYADRFRTSVQGEYGAFLAARTRRIFPLNWVCLGVTVLLVKSFPDHWWGPGPFSSRSLVYSVFLVQNWVPSTALAWNHPAWSLSAEWLAYLAFPFLAAAMAFLKRTIALAGAVSALVILEIYLFSIGSSSLDHVGAGGIVRCLCEFSAGALIWKTMQGASGVFLSNGDAWVALGMALLGVAVGLPKAQTLAPFGFAALIVGCVLPSRLGQGLFGNRLVLGLGAISFSIYLIHIPIVASLGLLTDRFRLQDAGLLPRLALLVATPALVLGASVLLWHFVEVPSRALFRPSPGQKPTQKPAARASVMFAFWIMVLVAMTFSDTAADFLSSTVGAGYGLSIALLLVAAVAMLAGRIGAHGSEQLMDWALILCTSIAGAILSDFLDNSIGLGDPGAAVALALTLFAIVAVNRRIPTGGHARIGRVQKSETVLNWLALLLMAALCTSLGDILGERSGLQYGGGSLVILGGLACIALFAVCTRLPRKVLFWTAFVLIRPLGVTLGDALSKSRAAGGLELGAGNSSLILAAAMIVMIPIAGPRFVALVRQLLVGRPSRALA